MTCVVIDRPARKNAVDRETAAGLHAAFAAFDEDEGQKVAVLTGAGETFCAGADLIAFAEGDGNRIADEGPGPMGPSRMSLHKPVIAAVEGHAVAGGLELAAWADLRVAAEDAVFGVFCRRFGVPLIDGGTARLPRLIGESRALDWILTGRAVPAAEAHQAGFVHRVAPKGKAKAVALGWADELSRLPFACLQADLQSARGALDVPLDEALREEFRRGRGVLDEARRGAAAFARGVGRHGSSTSGQEF